MKKFINSVDDFLTESLAGFAAAHSDLVALNQEPVFVRRKTLKTGKVALISGGGSGHEPLHSGFVGYGMLDAARSSAGANASASISARMANRASAPRNRLKI